MKKGTHTKAAQFPLSEYILAGVGLALICSVLIFLVVDEIRETHTPPRIVTHLKDIQQMSPGYVTQFIVKNEGGVTATQLKLQATLTIGENVESRDVIIDHLPPRSQRIVGFYFMNKPTKDNVEVKPWSYLEP
jgi:uncharacterized protein (TIGR02588 family)